MINKPPMIEFKNVSKVYYGKPRPFINKGSIKNGHLLAEHVLNDISFSIKKGERVALIGKNGAGKSTILKMITGVCHQTSGVVRVGGKVGAMLELLTGFEPKLTGRENIYIKGAIMGFSNKEMRKFEKQIIDFSELESSIDKPVKSYSSGMKARLGFAINMSVCPDILIVDEALSVGDRAFQKKCKNSVDDAIKRGVTFLLVTHSMDTAKQFCDRGIVLVKGEIIEDGDIEHAIKTYQDA